MAVVRPVSILTLLAYEIDAQMRIQYTNAINIPNTMCIVVPMRERVLDTSDGMHAANHNITINPRGMNALRTPIFSGAGEGALKLLNRYAPIKSILTNIGHPALVPGIGPSCHSSQSPE